MSFERTRDDTGEFLKRNTNSDVSRATWRHQSFILHRFRFTFTLQKPEGLLLPAAIQVYHIQSICDRTKRTVAAATQNLYETCEWKLEFCFFVNRKILMYCKILLLWDKPSCTLTDTRKGDAWRRADDTDSSEITVYLFRSTRRLMPQNPSLNFYLRVKTHILRQFMFKIVFLSAFVSCFEIFNLLRSHLTISANENCQLICSLWCDVEHRKLRFARFPVILPVAEKQHLSCMLPFGWFSGVWILYVDVSEHSVYSIFIGG
jgi:hypothetical protein